MKPLFKLNTELRIVIPSIFALIYIAVTNSFIANTIDPKNDWQMVLVAILSGVVLFAILIAFLALCGKTTANIENKNGKRIENFELYLAIAYCVVTIVFNLFI